MTTKTITEELVIACRCAKLYGSQGETFDGFSVSNIIDKALSRYEQLAFDPTYAGNLEAQFRDACQELINAEHHDHFAARMSDSELAAIDKMKALLGALNV